MFYTHKERTEKKFTLDDISNAALGIVKDRSKGKLTQICVNCFKGVNETSLFTMEEMNNFTRKIVDDTFYHDGWKMHT